MPKSRKKTIKKHDSNTEIAKVLEAKKAKPKKDNSKKIIIGAAILVVIAAVVLLIIFLPKANKVLATVNGEKITLEEVNERYGSIPAQYKAVVTKQQILDQIIDEKVLVWQAEKLGIPKNKTAIDEKIESIIKQAAELQGITVEELDAKIMEQGTSLAEIRKQYKTQLIIGELLDTEIASKIEVTDDEIAEFYEKNKHLLFEPANVTARHILVMIDQNRTDEEASDIIKEVEAKINAGANFCDMVEQYSDDTASVETCGEYSFNEQASFVQEFKTAAFSQDAGESSIAKTVYGYHLVQTVEKTERRELPLSEVKDALMDDIKNTKIRDEYAKYIAALKETADIEPKNPLIPVEEAEPLASETPAE
ncbi:MAG: peptidylprolyl isomerase [Candidatus Woesearchaeota archaeon]